MMLQNCVQTYGVQSVRELLPRYIGSMIEPTKLAIKGLNGSAPASNYLLPLAASRLRLPLVFDIG